MKTKQEPEKAIPETQDKYKDIIFGFDSRICGGCLEEPQEQIDDDRIYQERLKEWQVRDICLTLNNTVEEDGVLIVIRTSEVLGFLVDNEYYKNIFDNLYDL